MSAPVLLATFSEMPEGEPGAAALDHALAERGVTASWAVWDDPAVRWQDAALVAVRSTWDYDWRLAEFLTWADGIGPGLLNGAAVFRWNTDKAYLVDLAAAGVPVVPTRSVARADELAEVLAGSGTAVVKPRSGAGGRGVAVVQAGTAYRYDHPGPWVVQPLVESVTTLGERSVFVLDGRAISQVDKVPAPGEIRVHEFLGGISTAVPLDPELAGLARETVATASRLLGADLAYARVDALRYADRWVVSELEVTEPGLYLDVLPGNALPFADLVAARVRR